MYRLLFILFALFMYFSLDYYTYTGFKSLVGGSKIFQWMYWVVSAAVLLGFYKVFIDLQNYTGGVRPPSTNFILGLAFAIFISKLFFGGLLFLQDGGRLIVGLFRSVANIFSNSEITSSSIPDRRKFLTLTAATIVSIPFLGMLYGITKGKYNYSVEKIKLAFKDLPTAFKGFRIVQISDIHSGSYDSIAQVEKGVDLVLEQKPDLIVFTGDLVNSQKNEIDPYLDAFSKLEAPMGMYSILGNHDYYGMYRIPTNNSEARKAYFDDFESKHTTIGFTLMNNTSTKIEKEGQSIRLIGVENWGAGPFPKTGDLDKALQGVSSNEFSILLSHDPTHWDHHVIPNKKHIHLTLSGHTHGMQFGINLPKFKWSPVKYRYKKWMGLYKEAGQYLYVNRGFGFLGWPGRVGMTPEITVIDLEKIT